MNKGHSIENVIDLDEYFCQLVAEEDKKTYTGIDRKTNCTVLAFITARNRIRLHRQMMVLEKDGSNVFYCDTDSILFATHIQKKNCPFQ